MTKNTSVYKNIPQKEYDISDEKRDEYRRKSQKSRLARLAADEGRSKSVHPINIPNLKAEQLMPQLSPNNLRALSLFSGGGGLDLGFDLAGYEHVASYELIPICQETLQKNRPHWKIFGGSEFGDVTKVDWTSYVGKVDVIHGGPPCQPFSIAGSQKGEEDDRNMWGEFNRAINIIKPKAFIAENVLGILNPKFNDFIQKFIYEPLNDYYITRFEINASDYGVPQIRRRVFFIGFQKESNLNNFNAPIATHSQSHFKNNNKATQIECIKRTMGVREALGLNKTGIDILAPTIRSGFTGKRNTTSILNSAAGQKTWGSIEIWPNGVQANRKKASNFPAKEDHFRLSVQDIGLMQGFPEKWEFSGAVYQILGQIGNSVAPPVAYQVAKNVAEALLK